MNTFYATAENINSTFSKIYKDAQKKTLTACINTVNIQAAKARQNAIQNLQADFTLRNKFTVGSIRYTQCPKNIKDFAQIMSVIGATQRADYLERQEQGGLRTPERGSRLAIPTVAARNGSNTSLIRQKYRVGKMQKVDRNSKKHGTYRGNLVAAAYVAAKNNLVLHYYNQIYKVENFVKIKPESNSKSDSENKTIDFKATELYNKNHIATFTPKKEWLAPAIEQPAQDCQLIFNQQMDIIFTK